MRTADVIIKYLELNRVEYIFGIPSGTISGLYDAINDSKIKPIIVKNEAAATYSAARYANLCNKLGVCMLAGAVGINNAINGIGDAYKNKLPLLVISGYVNRNQVGKGAVQELNTELITKSITKYSKTVFNENIVLDELKKAVETALTPPYGPVHISIPMDIPLLPYNKEIPTVTKINKPIYDEEDLKKAVHIINKSEKGLIIVGRGARGHSEKIKNLCKKLKWYCATTPQGKGVIDMDFPYNLGNYGFCSTEKAASYVDYENLNCVLVLGSSLGESATRNFNENIIKDKTLIHIDFDANELNKVFKNELGVYHEIGQALELIYTSVYEKSSSFEPIISRDSEYIENHTGISIRKFLEKIVYMVPENTCFLSDIGEFMNFVFRYLPIKEGMDFETSLNYGAMGSAVAGVMGAYLANPKRKCAVIVGDGSFFMNGTEILTAKEYNMPIVYFVINNSMLGYVENGMNFIFNRSVDGVVQNRVSIADMCRAIGIEAYTIGSLEKLDELEHKLKFFNKPLVIELITDGTERVPAADRFKALTN